MNKKVKYLMIALAVLVLLIGGFYFAGKSLLKSDTLKQKIEHLVEDNTGRKLSIQGPLDIRILPWPRVSVTGLALSNPEGFDQAQPFAECKRLQVDVALWPLLSGKVNFKQVNIDGAQINLLVKASGRTNWEMTQTSSSALKGERAKQAQNKSSQTIGALPNVSVKNSSVRIINYQTHQVSNFTHVNWSLKPGFVKQTMTLNGVYSNLKKHQTLPMHLKIVNTIKQKHIFNLVVLLKSELNQEKNNQMVKLPFTLNGRIVFNNKTKEVEVKRLQLMLDKLNLNGGFKTNLLNTQKINGHIQLKPLDVNAFMDRMSGEKNNGQPMVVSFQSNWSKDHSKLALNDIKGQLGGGNFSGYVYFTQGIKPSFNFDIQMAKINLGTWQANEELTQKKSKNAPAPNQPLKSSSHKGDQAKANASLQALSGSGRLAIKQLQAHHLIIKNILIKVTASQGGIRFEMPKADVSGGQAQALLKINQVKNQLLFSGQWSNIALQDLQKAMDRKVVLAGHADGKLEISAPLSNAKTHRRLINGSGSLKIIDGQIMSKKSLEAIKEAGPSAPGIESQNGVVGFDSFNTAFKINQGVVDNYLVNLKSPKLLVKGSGSISLLDESYKYQLDFSKAAGKMPVPLLITGNLDGDSKPHVKVNAKKLVHQLIQKRRESREEGGPAGGIFNGRLRNLLNR